MIEQVLDLFGGDPVLLTDELTNSVFFNEKAEKLYHESGDAIVNRAAYSLLGFESFEGVPQSLVDALMGKRDAWRGFVKVPGQKCTVCFCEASALVREEELICGLIRFDLLKKETVT